MHQAYYTGMHHKIIAKMNRALIKNILQAGISKILYLSDKYSERTSFKASRKMLEAAKVEFIRLVPEQDQINIDLAEILKEDPTYSGSN